MKYVNYAVLAMMAIALAWIIGLLVAAVVHNCRTPEAGEMRYGDPFGMTDSAKVMCVIDGHVKFIWYDERGAEVEVKKISTYNTWFPYDSVATGDPCTPQP